MIGYDLSLLMIDIDHFKAFAQTHEHLVGRADAALYEAKVGGRNQVRWSQPA